MAPRPPHPSASDEKLITLLDRAFEQHAGEDAKIDAADLKKALGLRSDYLAERVLKQFDTNGDGAVSREEFSEGVRRLIFGTDREKLEFAFQLHDHDGNGTLDEHELYRMIAMALAESDVRETGRQSPERLAHALMVMADKNRDGKITFEEFEHVMRKRPAILESMTRAEAMWIAPSEDLLARLDGAAGPGRGARAAQYLQNHWLEVTYLAVWALVNVALFVVGFGADRAPGGSHFFTQLGHAFGTCMDFNGALILVPVMRRVLTWLRATPPGRLVPIDHAIDFHKLTGHALFALALAHSLSFTASYLSGHATGTIPKLLFQTHRGMSGFALLVVFAVMWAFALGRIRRTSRFELFYFTHLLYIAWFVLAVIHAPSFALWAGVPALGFGIEQLVRVRRRAHRTVIVHAEALRSGVTRLDIARPPDFKFSPGDYVFLCIPTLARHEWHPFTISSAPENDMLTVHVRSLGNWTAALRRFAERKEINRGLGGAMAVHVDGPYGSPSAHLFDSRYAVFIGAGIGVTPFASVLESLVLRANGGRPSPLRKAHFIWLNRDQYSFEWFAELLEGVEERDKNDLIDVQLFMTGGRTSATSVGLEIAREITHAAGYKDLVTGLKTKTIMGHPDWNVLLGELAKAHAPDRVDVFFCGPSGLGAKIRRTCEGLGMTFREEKF